ncbi:MAG: HAMP domain-containing histidine kinase [Lawsonibacter sp.]|nr:HAMP domain-containing histidine kinase [Lawsonibacter sp.]MCI9567339.1 HAMP domain-containing histidine kinase [Lawsonibacter sp.]
MKKVQGNPLVKWTAVLLFLALTFSGAREGMAAIACLPYVGTGSWQETGYFQSLIWKWESDVAAFCADMQAKPEEDGLTYIERQQLEQRLEAARARLAPSVTNFRYRVRLTDGAEAGISNLSEGESLERLVDTVYYAVFLSGQRYAVQSMEELRNILDQFQPEAVPQELEGEEAFDGAAQTELPQVLVIECGVPAVPDSTGGKQDEFANLYALWQVGRDEFPNRLSNSLLLLGLALGCLCLLLWTAGCREGVEKTVLSWQERIWFDVYCILMLAGGIGAFAGAWELCGQMYWRSLDTWAFGSEYDWLLNGGSLLLTLAALCAALTLRTLTVRLKAGNLARTTLCSRVVQWMAKAIHKGIQFGRELVRAFPFLWRVLVAYGVYFCANFFFLLNLPYSTAAGLVWFALHAALLLLLCWWAMGFQRLRQGSRAIAAGDLDLQIDTRHMPYDLRCHAEDLNNISIGLAGAVDEKMRSERFKAELITNVSHDLKTPLTSIINYVSLLKTTRQDDPTALEYIEVLDRKSQRLKKLTEDLVEASKASTGVLSVSREKIGMSQLMDQALGEWTEKLEARKLTPVITLPEGETWVYADGRHLWRVIDNLLSNCAKYALESTRIYLDLTRGKGQVLLSVKNISREPLNVPPERLMERFVRGEESRTTEGSGLGLSIARSLTELQGGQFDLVVDGDLFKAIVTLPQAN